MKSFPDFTDNLARIRRFTTNGRRGDALITLDLHGSGFPLPPRTPFPRWRFPTDLHRYLDEQIALLLATWEHKRGLDEGQSDGVSPLIAISDAPAVDIREDRSEAVTS